MTAVPIPSPLCPPDIISKDREGLVHLNDRVAKNSAILPIFQSPIIKGLTSPAGTERWITNHLFKHEFRLGKNVDLIASGRSLEEIVNEDYAIMQIGAKQFRDIYVDALGVKPNTAFADLKAVVKSVKTGNPSMTDFERWVSFASRRGDKASTEFMTEAQVLEFGKAVEKGAKVLRKQRDLATDLLNKRKDLFPETFADGTPFTVKFAETHFSRNYSVDAITNTMTSDGKNAFKELLRKHFSRNISDPRKLNEAIDDTYSNILGMGDDAIEMNAVLDNYLKQGQVGVDPMPLFFKKRVLNIPDTELEPFLHHNALDITFGYTNQAYNLVRTMEKFEEMGVQNIGDLQKLVRNDFENLIVEAPVHTTTAQKIKGILSKNDLRAKQIQAMKDVQHNFNIVNGRFTHAFLGEKDFPLLQRLRKYNVLTMLGGVLISSIPDLSMNVFKHGFGEVWQDGLMKTSRQWAKAKMSNEALADLGIAMEVDMNSLIKAITDPDFSYGKLTNTQFDKILDATSRTFTKATGLNVWNSWGTRMGHRISQARLVRLMRKIKSGEGISQLEGERLASLGIGKDQYNTIIRNLDFAEDVDGAVFANAHLWDPEAKKLVASMLRRDETILKPNKGDIPTLFQGSDVGKSIFQFKSFGATAHNKIMLAGLQRANSQGIKGFAGNEAQGLMMLISLGAGVYVLKERLKGREPNLDIDNLIMEGMFRSGTLGLMGESLALQPFFRTSSRYAGLNAQGAMLGPSGTQVAKALETAGGLTDGEVSDRDIEKLTKFIPFNNLFYISDLLKGIVR